MNLNTKVGLGSVQFGTSYGISNINGQTSEDEVNRILEYASKNDISIIDTASGYGNAEIILGKNNLNDFKIVSKFMPPINGGSINTQLERSLSNLNISSLYGYLAHRPLELLSNKSHWEDLQYLKQENKIEKIGFSLNKPEELTALLKKKMLPDLVQVPYNYFDNRFKDQLIELKIHGCEIHTRSTFLQGLFFTDVNKLPSFFDCVKEAISNLQMRHTDNLSGVLLKHILLLDFVDHVIIGVENTKQLIENLNGINSSLPILEYNKSIPDSILMPVYWPK